MYPSVKAKTSARWAKRKEALRAACEEGPRAALTSWGERAAPEAAKKWSGWSAVLSLLRKSKRSGAKGRWCKMGSSAIGDELKTRPKLPSIPS